MSGIFKIMQMQIKRNKTKKTKIKQCISIYYFNQLVPLKHRNDWEMLSFHFTINLRIIKQFNNILFVYII